MLLLKLVGLTITRGEIILDTRDLVNDRIGLKNVTILDNTSSSMYDVMQEELRTLNESFAPFLGDHNPLENILFVQDLEQQSDEMIVLQIVLATPQSSRLIGSANVVRTPSPSEHYFEVMGSTRVTANS